MATHQQTMSVYITIEGNWMTPLIEYLSVMHVLVGNFVGERRLRCQAAHYVLIDGALINVHTRCHT